MSGPAGQRQPQRGRPGGFGPGGMMMGGPPPEKPKDFGGSFRRLLGRLRPERALVAVVLVFAIGSVSLVVVGPKILGDATNIIFQGFIGSRLPAGSTQAQAEAGLRATGQNQLADMLGGMHVTPGVGIDFSALGNILLLLGALYLVSAAFGWGQAYLMAGVTQRTVYRLRQDVDAKLGRLPLKYFDDHPRGDVLSRVTNDIDNIGQTLQQSLTQLITSVLTVIGVLVLMFTINFELALISVLAIPASLIITVLIIRRSQKLFVAQWASTGALNGQVEEMHTGHNIVTVFGRQKESSAKFEQENERLYNASYRAQFISGIIQPSMSLISNLNYVAIAVIGGLRVASGQMSLGDVVAFIQYSRQFTQPIVQAASIANVLQSAVASAERVFELLDEPEMVSDPAQPRVLNDVRGEVVFDDVSFRYRADTPLIENLSLTADPGHTIAIVGPTGAGKTTLVNLLMRFYEIDAGRITVDGRDLTRAPIDDRISAGMGLVPEDRQRDGIVQLLSVGENLSLASIRALVRGALVSRSAERAQVDAQIANVHVKTDGRDAAITSLSGGNQQKVAIGRMLMTQPKVLLLDEPTRGIDVGAKGEIFRLLFREAGRGLAVLFVTSEVSEALAASHRVIVMRRGRIAAEFDPASASREDVMVVSGEEAPTIASGDEAR